MDELLDETGGGDVNATSPMANTWGMQDPSRSRRPSPCFILLPSNTQLQFPRPSSWAGLPSPCRSGYRGVFLAWRVERKETVPDPWLETSLKSNPDGHLGMLFSQQTKTWVWDIHGTQQIVLEWMTVSYAGENRLLATAPEPLHPGSCHPPEGRHPGFPGGTQVSEVWSQPELYILNCWSLFLFKMKKGKETFSKARLVENTDMHLLGAQEVAKR